ncbi:hypothetical protein [Pseudomonas syringae]|uniref:hypothetical protein n=1 Tax=Pseudomonas syringae TaxID=317 RepID=UPI0013728007|nr:hypothetical protein [Pseudomonas syringae]NAT21381.1 hypothetical protein [Pseudomonas syringae pv. actinidifoliorum]NAT39689.1 hypothetical protein [Pseudomonas syringae pv. actinidifoliorum]
MTTLDLFNTDFELTDNGLRLAESLHESTGELFSYKNDYIIKKDSSLYLNEMTVQKENADTAKAPTLGFESTMIALSQIDPQTTILMRFIESPTWDGRVFLMRTKLYSGPY